MHKRMLFFSVLVFFLSVSIWAGGRKANESHEVENPEGFTERIDTSEKKPGKYNFYLEAADKGENITRAGPYNIRLDPESDLPIVTIANPRDKMHIQGNLNIVGTCVDDDAVSYVELWFNNDEETLVRAEGTEFWSYYYDTTQLADGLYTISVRGVDVNGLQGRVKQVTWNLDRKKPETKITSHHLGALVNGKISLKGTVFDGNGVKSLAYSVDGGKKYADIPVKFDKRNNIYNFDLSVNTKTFDDGPVVIWFRAYDNMGTLGAISHLLFVDNSGPDIQIITPTVKEKVNGIFNIAGFAKDRIGLESLTWKLGKETGEFPIIIGNPYWVKEVDIRGQKLSGLDFEIRAVDLSGNVTVKKVKLSVDQNADMPKVIVDEPKAGAVTSGGSINLIGNIVDNEGAAFLYYAIDGGAPVEIPCAGYFQLTIKDIPDGTHNLEVWAKDKTGAVGSKTLVKGIINPGSEPQPQIIQVSRGGGKTVDTEEFRTGMEINSESGSSFVLRVRSGAALQSITYSLGSRGQVTVPAKGSKGGEFIQNIPIPADMDFGLVKMGISARDVNGNETLLEEYVYITDLTSPRVIENHVSANRLSDDTVTLTSLNGEQSWPDQIIIPRGQKAGIPVSATIDPGLQVGKAVFEAAGRIVNASAKNGIISAVLPADLPAGLIQLSLKVTQKSGETNEVGAEFWLLRPRVDGQEINTREGFTWVRPDTSMGGGRILLSNTGETLLGLYNGRPLTRVEISGSGSNSFSVRLDEYGRVNLLCSAAGSYGPLQLTLTDKDGKTFTTGQYNFYRAASNPSLEFIQNPENRWIQNQIALNFTVSGDSAIKAIEYSANLGVSWEPLVSGAIVKGAVIEGAINVASLPDGAINLSVKVTDEAKGEMVRSFFVNKDTKAPYARVIVPVEEDRVNGTIHMGIAIEEAGQLATVMYERPASNTGGVAVPAISKNLWTYNPNDENALPLMFMDLLMDTKEMPLADNMRFTFSDLSGNSFALDAWPFVIDKQMDIPVVEISLPLEGEVITTDFVISGIVYDDDAVARIYWNLDNNPQQTQDVSYGYSIPVRLSDITDNEHKVTIVAEDIYGVKSEPVIRNFKVSLEEPKSRLETPPYDKIVRGTVTLTGVASDMNGIEKVKISLDNGNSFNDATGTTNWSYMFNSKILEDGTHVVFTRVFDKYGISALYSSLINIDNTPPEVVLDAPLDGMITTGNVYITGRTTDNIMMEKISIEVRSLNGYQVPANIASLSVPPGSILMQPMNLSSLRDGLYNIEVWAVDKAENITRVSRNIQLAKESNPNYVDILYPLDGEYVQGSFNLYGIAGGVDSVSVVTVFVNGNEIGTAEVSETGFYRFGLGDEFLSAGANRIEVRSDFGGRAFVRSPEHTLTYNPSGAWVTIDTLAMGDFAYERPWLSGRAGYNLSEEDQNALLDKSTEKELKEAIKAKKLTSIELSFDNGKTFIKAGRGRDKGFNWSYRLETGDMPEGVHYLIVRANMANNETAVTRTLIQVDKTPPIIRLISPQAGGVYNASLEYTALASDDVNLKSLSYHLRAGDKAAYEVPGFIQGLYFEGVIPPFIRQVAKKAPVFFAGGATYFDVGFGLSFFDDNVKVQVQYGLMNQKLYSSMGEKGPVRFGGHVLGLKLLANIYTLPFGSFAGPDWEWLKASFAIGANFSLFDLGREGYTQSGSPTWLSALVGQLEFPKVTIPNRSYLRTFSLFTEGQLWFVSTDVDATANNILTVIPHIIVGLRMYIF